MFNSNKVAAGDGWLLSKMLPQYDVMRGTDMVG